MAIVTVERTRLCDFILHLDEPKFAELYRLISTKYSMPREYTTDDFNEETLEAIREGERRQLLGPYTDVDTMMRDLLSDA